MPYPNFIGNKRFWTRERVLATLNRLVGELQGPLPCHDLVWNRMKKGHLDWPTASRILDYFHSMARAWLATGAPMSRVTLHNQDWLPEEDAYLLDKAGTLTLNNIAERLRRTQPAVRARLNRVHGIASRANQGYLSASELAKEYNCSCHRIRKALAEGKIKGRFDEKRNRWQIDLLDVLKSPVALTILSRPRRTHKYGPTDLGDYYQRYGLKRTLINGQVKVVPKEALQSTLK